MGEDSEPVSTSKVGGVIPFFFYDAIGRIIPGAFLLVGILITMKGGRLLGCWPSLLQAIFPKESTVGYSTVVVLLFLGTAHFVGTVLGALSHAFIEAPSRIWYPLNLDGLSKYIGAGDIHELKSRFRRRFGSNLNDDNLNEFSFLCSYHVWTVDQNLGAMTGRIDAECLGARSCLLVGVALAFAAGLRIIMGWLHPDTSDWIWLVSVSVITIGTAFSFHYLRKRRLYGRFAMFLATSVPEETHRPTTERKANATNERV